jgi:hypothetical protein
MTIDSSIVTNLASEKPKYQVSARDWRANAFNSHLQPLRPPAVKRGIDRKLLFDHHGTDGHDGFASAGLSGLCPAGH